GVRGSKPQARTERSRYVRAGARMIDASSFGDVVQERREIKLGAMSDLRQDLGRERQLLAKPARFDRAKFSNGANEMLIDGVVVIHRELHHAHDAAEIENEAA